MHPKLYVRFGGRAGETHQLKAGRAPRSDPTRTSEPAADRCGVPHRPRLRFRRNGVLVVMGGRSVLGGVGLGSRRPGRSYRRVSGSIRGSRVGMGRGPFGVVLAVVVSVVLAVGVLAQGSGDCYVGLVVEPGGSCSYPGTDVEFRVDDSGSGRLLFFSSGQRIELRATSINGVEYTFVASRQSGGGWLIEEVGGSAATGPATTPTTAPPATVGGDSGAYTDVEGSVHQAAISALADDGVFVGTECAPARFCPTDAVDRWVMAVWLVRILDGAAPASVGSSRFADVDTGLWWAPYVERLADLGVTDGCATEPDRFCPTETVTRARMASFLVRAFDLPGAPSAGFADVEGGVHAANIDALAASGITSGCRTQPLRYCPSHDTTRAQMATFLSRALNKRGPTDRADADRETLVALYNATDGTNWTNDTNWLSDRPISEWYGVTTDDDGRVTRLNLTSNQLKGQIPSSLDELESLKWLSLGNNQLTGRVPPELAALTKLESLYLYRNQLTGTIPPELGTLSNLTTLSLHRNQLTGTIPPELGTLSNLTTLSLHRNQLTGTISSELGRLSDLENLSLSHNRLTGAIPPVLAGLTKLQLVAVSQNQLTGCIPPDLLDVATNDLEELGLPNCGETTEPATEGKAVTGEISKCSGSRIHADSSLVDITVAGTVTAHRSVSSVKVEAKVGLGTYFPDPGDPLWGSFLSRNYVGSETIGSMKAGEVRNFSIRGLLDDPSGKCVIQTTWED